MPIQTFQCESCGLRFRKRTKTDNCKCDCGVQVYSAKRLSVGFGSDVSGVQAQNTGMESLDLSYDRVVGEDARMKWETIYNRRKDKWDMINDAKDSTGYDILREEDGTYTMNRQVGSVLKENRDYGMDMIKQSKNQNT
jgi:hypothetical protein